MANSYIRLRRKDYRILEKIFDEKPLPWSEIRGLLSELREQLGGEIDDGFGATRICIKLDHGDKRNVYQKDLHGTTDEANIRAIRKAIESARVKPKVSKGGWSQLWEFFQMEVVITRV